MGSLGSRGHQPSLPWLETFHIQLCLFEEEQNFSQSHQILLVFLLNQSFRPRLPQPRQHRSCKGRLLWGHWACGKEMPSVGSTRGAMPGPPAGLPRTGHPWTAWPHHLALRKHSCQCIPWGKLVTAARLREEKVSKICDSLLIEGTGKAKEQIGTAAMGCVEKESSVTRAQSPAPTPLHFALFPWHTS